MVSDKNKQLLFIGMGNYLMCLKTIDVQAYLAKAIIEGIFIVPDLSSEDVKQ
jgi:hypothetical protein